MTAKAHKLNVQQMFMGQHATGIVSNNSDSVTVKFVEQLSNTYEKCAAYMQKKLPLNSSTLQGLSAMDPVGHGHSVTQKHLNVLTNKLQHFLPEDQALL